MSGGFEFLSTDGATAPARSPLERDALAAGARLEERDGWRIAAYDGPEPATGWADRSHLGKLELQATDLPALTAGIDLRPGRATRAANAWWCPLTPERALVLCEPADLAGLRSRLEEAAADLRATASAGGADAVGPVGGDHASAVSSAERGSAGGDHTGTAAARAHASVTDLTTAYAALTIAGPDARELIARFCAIDLRPQAAPPAALRPGSIARQPGIVLREADDRFLLLFGAALAHYVWTVVADAGEQFGARPIGAGALAQIPEPIAAEA